MRSTKLKPYLIYAVASDLCKAISDNGAIAIASKHHWYKRVAEAAKILVNGIEITFEEWNDPDNPLIILPSAPGKKREPGEAKGHKVDLVHKSCSCLAAQHNDVCWGRAAAHIIKVVLANPENEIGADMLEDTDLFEEEVVDG